MRECLDEGIRDRLQYLNEMARVKKRRQQEQKSSRGAPAAKPSSSACQRCHSDWSVGRYEYRLLPLLIRSTLNTAAPPHERNKKGQGGQQVWSASVVSKGACRGGGGRGVLYSRARVRVEGDDGALALGVARRMDRREYGLDAEGARRGRNGGREGRMRTIRSQLSMCGRLTTLREGVPGRRDPRSSSIP